MIGRLVKVSLLSVALFASAPAAAQAVELGIGDQKTDMFSDPLFASLEIRHARVAVSWDVVAHQWQRDALDHWLEGAKQAGVEPLVGFWHAKGDRRRVLPTPERFAYEFRRFRKRYPWVRNFAVWNEANHCGEPTCHRPRLVALYYKALRKECPYVCKILAAELLDMPNMGWWVKEFLRKAKVQPAYWGLHNYLDANRFRTSGTRKLLELTTGRIWFTETGGIVKRRRRNPHKVAFQESTRHAADATRWVFDRLVPLSTRITRVYLYHWNAPRKAENWDSALIDKYGRPRPAMRVLRRELVAQSVARRKAGAARSR